ncbi:plasmid pRiA4b ORF-3 family protein [Pseudonocardia sp.]|uniref:plasmid pRiA4b ORF-3 family protein n=1 Tax=Pseudonocardia sp. TaxID=60912 RepID=UPI0026358CCC|nr:plasmid pRiA4b ORF-3 family protein [Pseudonocardia sp.]
MSPKSRGRKRKPAPASRRRRDDPFGDTLFSGILRDVGRDLDRIDDAVAAELCVSALLGTWWKLFLVDADPEVELGERLVAVAARRNTTAALALLRTVAVLGTPAQRAAAGAAADALAAKGVTDPTWARELSGGRARSAWGYGDVFGDQTSILLTVERGGDTHGVVVLIDHALGGIAKDAFVTDDPAGTLADIRSLSEPDVWIRELTLDEAARLLRPAFAATDGAAEPPVGEDFREYRALALARVRLLPDVEREAPPALDDAGRDALVREFLASDHARELVDAGLDDAVTAGCARLIVEHGCATDGRPLRVGPAKVDLFLLSWLPDQDLDEDTREVMPDVLRAWVRWAGRRADLPEPALQALEEIVDELADLDDQGPDGLPPGLADAVLDGLLDGDVTPEQVQEAVTRRVFATPDTTVVLDGERMQLDPSDPDERGLLVRAEHPEYAEALDDPFADVATDEVNPRLHVAMHEMVATQLWDGEPAQVWPAAQRLLATGMDRHDVLHALAEVAARHVHAALVRQQPYDAAAYAADLAELGTPPPRARRRRKPSPQQEGLFDEPATVTPLRPPTRTGSAYRIKVTLRGVRPPVWRRLLVPPDTTLAGLHEILQVAMGWLDGHLHEFVAGTQLFGPPDPDAGPGRRDEAGVQLDEVLRRSGDRLRYSYDFGDGWEHDIVLESMEAETVDTARCTAGRRACPPEDCGGPWGYAELLAAVSDPGHPDHAERVEWAGPYFDPAEFDRAAVNDQLRALAR